MLDILFCVKGYSGGIGIMKKKIVLGSILAVFLLMMLPTITAVEYNTAVETNKSPLFKMLFASNSELSESSTPIILTWIVWFLMVVLPDALFMLYYVIARLLGIEAPPEKI